MRAIEPREPGLLNVWREFWRYRALLLFFGRRMLLRRFANTWLGWLWLPLRPAVMLSTRILVFGGLIGIATGSTPYALVFVVATTAWTLFSETAFWSARSIELNRKLLPHVYVPKLTLIASALVLSLVEFGIYVCFVIAGTLYYFVRADFLYLDIGLKTLLVPLGLFFLVMLGLGVGLLTASAGARARDIRFSLAYVLGFVYFLTPVIYPLSTVPPKWRPLAELNPLTGAIEMVKDGLFSSSHELSSDAVLVTAIAVFIIWIPGLWLFDRREVGMLHGRPQRWFSRPARFRRARG
ncbi:MAG TPA: ABC transporter permease [Gaiellaceae bacterium]|nr:ABC transporter permease [Gaiellaceae bacterium]